MKIVVALLGALLSMSLPDPIAHADEAERKITDSATLIQFPVSYTWEELTNLAQGTLTTTITGNAGGLSATLGGDVGNCAGAWEHRGGNINTVGGSHGVWSVHCDNGLTAAGTYKMTDPRRGKGEGRDAIGRCVNFQIGTPERVEAVKCTTKPGVPLLLSLWQPRSSHRRDLSDNSKARLIRRGENASTEGHRAASGVNPFVRPK